MRLIPLAAIPNQSLSIVLNENLFELRIETRGGSILVDVRKNNADIVKGARAVAGAPVVLPSSRLDNENFIFLTQEGDILDYEKFGVTQFLYYLQASEFVIDTTIPPYPFRPEVEPE